MSREKYQGYFSSSQIGKSMVIIACAIGLILIILFFKKSKINNSDKLKSKYEQALSGTDTHRAMKEGRAYYKALRGKDKQLSPIDEQVILNDVSRMETPP